MTRTLSLAHLTAIDLSPPDLILAAAEAEFHAVGLRLIAVTDDSPGYPIMTDQNMMRQTRSALRATGLAVHDIEFVKLQPETDVAALLPFLEAGGELGAREVITAPYDDDLIRLGERLAALSELAGPFGLKVSLEFFPWTSISDFPKALGLVRHSGSDAGVLVDTLHFDRSGSSLGSLRQAPADRLRFAQICDAPVQPPYSMDSLLTTARAERLLPGQGEIDLVGILRELPPDIPLGVEIPMTRRIAELGTKAFLQGVMRATRSLLEQV